MTTSTFPAKEKLFKALPMKFQQKIIRQAMDDVLTALDIALNASNTSHPKKPRRKASTTSNRKTK